MPQTLAQIMGMLVTALVVLGTDLDVLYAVPLGIFAGAITTYLASYAPEPKEKPKVSDLRDPPLIRGPVDG